MHQKPHNPENSGHASSLTRTGRAKFPFVRGVAAAVAALGLGATASAASFTLPGWLNYEYYPNKLRTDVEAGTAGTPSTFGQTQGSDKSGYVSSFEAGNNFAENYANRIYGLFIPPTTGNYVFFIASDDDSDLFLSTDADPANKHLIAQEAGWSGIRSWITVGGTSAASDKRSDTFALTEWPGAAVGATVINLTAGNQYYIEAVHHEGGGGDNVGVLYKLDTDPDPVDGAAPNLKGSNIAITLPAAPTAPNVSFTQQPVGGTFYVGGSLALSAKVSSDSPFPIQYQWRKGGTAISGATSPNFSIGSPALTDSGNYDLQVTYVGAGGTPQTLTSSVAAVNVQTSPFVTGFLKYEYFPGSDRTTVEGGGATASTGGTTQGSDKSGYVNIAESGTNFADNYANRFSGYFIPPTDGNYIFLVASDDDGDLFLSTDDNPANKKLIAQETGWSGVRNYSTQGGGTGVEYKSSETFANSQWPGATPPTTVITLTHGQHYYIEYVHHEGGGGDNVAVTYRLDTEDAGLVADGTAPRLTGDVIGVSVPPQTITINTQPSPVAVYAGTDATLHIDATTTGSFPIQYQWRKGGVNITNATGSSYTIKAESGDAGNYDVVMTVPGDSKTSSVAALTVKSGSITVAGKLKREYFPGADRVAVENGNVSAPANVIEVSSLETFTNFADNYAERVSGLFTPATSGAYVFFVASDDDTDLFLSTDSTPAHKQLIAQELGWSGVRRYFTVGGGPANAQAQKRSDQFSPDGGTTTPFAAGISLTAGTAYYIEAVHHEGGGGDNLAVTFKLTSDPDPVESDGTGAIAGDPSLLTGSVISYITSPVTTASITTQPVNASSYEGQSAGFSVAINTDAEIAPNYQWRKGGNIITNATGSSYSIGFLAPGDAGNYDVVVTIPNLSGAAGTLTSSAASLQVLPAPLITGLLKYEYFPGKTRTDVEAGNGGTPSTAGTVLGGDKSGYVTIAETADGFADNYANRFSGFFIPPTTGNYVFFMYGDDDSDLFLSTDATPSNKKLIAQETGASGYRSWTTAPARRSDQFPGSEWPGAAGAGATIALTAGQLYYIEAVHHEGGGGDHLGVTYKLDTEADPSDADPYDASRLVGKVIGVKIVPPTLTTAPTMTAAYATTNDVTITFSQPIDHATVVAGNFSFAGTGTPAVTVGTPTAKEVLQGDNVVTVVTVPTTGFVANTTYTITANNVKNTAGIAIAGGANTFIATTPVLTLNFNDLTLPDGVTGGSNGAGLAGTIVDASGPDGTAAFWLTEAVNSEQGALIIQDLVAGQPVTNFTAVFKLLIAHGSGNPADGMSFNFGNIDPSVTSAGEEGVGTISVDFDTYNNGNTGPGGRPEAPAFEVKLNGSIIGWVPLPQAAIVNDQWVDVVVSLNPDNSITTIYNGVTYFDHLSLNNATDLVTGAALAPYTPISGAEFLIGGRTGGEHSQQSLDNFTISENAKVNDVTPPTKPTINVSSTGTGLTISWAPTATGFTLQSASSLTPPINWQPVAGVANNSVTVSTTSGNAYYRLVK